MKWINMVVEGETESAFVREVLGPHLSEKGIAVRKCVIVGRTVKMARISRDVISLLKQYSADSCSTMFDYYALPLDFPGKELHTSNKGSLEKAGLLESAIANAIGKGMTSSFDPCRFIPYVQMHEFEGLLFSDPALLAVGLRNPQLEKQFQSIRQAFKTPEDINDSFEECPSRRIRKICRYDKPASGVTAAKIIGLEIMRAECPHFSAWVAKLESLGDKA